jgi:ABC-2 type transport system permease protein
VLGKYLAAFATYVIMWLPTLLYVVILRKTGSVDWLVVLSSYLGILLVGAQYLAIGTLSSSLTKSQFVALLVTVLVQFGLFVLGIGEYIFDPGVFHDVCSYVSLAGHMEEFSKGIVDSRRLLYDASLTIFCLFLTTRVVDSWRRA